MIIRVIVQSDDHEHMVECKVDDMVLDPPTDREKAKQILWHAYEMAKMRLREKLAEVRHMGA